VADRGGALNDQADRKALICIDAEKRELGTRDRVSLMKRDHPESFGLQDYNLSPKFP
jgi:hypothetical protein